MKKYLKFVQQGKALLNGQIISFQDNFKCLAHVPFNVYFDFETTSGDSVVFFLLKNVHCELLSNLFISHPALNLDKKIVIFRSFQ